jgi:hypothetical protein
VRQSESVDKARDYFVRNARAMVTPPQLVLLGIGLTALTLTLLGVPWAWAGLVIAVLASRILVMVDRAR